MTLNVESMKIRVFLLSFLVLGSFFAGFSGSDASADGLEYLRGQEENHFNVYKKLKQSTVGITCEVPKGNPRFGFYYGTGVIISEQGHVLTTTSVIPGGAEQIEIYLPSGAVEKGTIIGASLRYDLTLVKIPSDGLPYFRFSRNDQIEVGDRVYTGGNAFQALHQQKKLNFSTGMISGEYETRSVYWQSPYEGVALEADTAINPGMDGGPMLNRKGELIGVITLATDRGRFMGLATPVYLFRSFINTLLIHDQKGPAEDGDPYLGATIDFDKNPPEVKEVTPDGPAEQAGLMEGDRILKIRNTSLEDDRSKERKNKFEEVFFDVSPRESLFIRIRREGRKWNLIVPVGDQPM